MRKEMVWRELSVDEHKKRALKILIEVADFY